MPTYRLVTVHPEGGAIEIDITEDVAALVDAASSLGDAVRERMDEHHETPDDALDGLTAEYGRAMIEEGGFDALRTFLHDVGVPFTEIPDGDS